MCWEQYQEEMDYQMGAASELQNAYAMSMMNRKPDDSQKIEDALAAGKHVIVEEGPEYCPITDALMGSRKFLVSEHATREEAEAALAGMEEGDPDISVYIRPYKPAPPPPVYDRDEIPF